MKLNKKGQTTKNLLWVVVVLLVILILLVILGKRLGLT